MRLHLQSRPESATEKLTLPLRPHRPVDATEAESEILGQSGQCEKKAFFSRTSTHFE